MSNNCILTSDGAFMSEDEYLQHWGLKKGEEKEDHKYIKREWKNGRWQYYYETPSKGGSTNGNTKRHDLKGLTKLADWAGADEKTKYETTARNKTNADDAFSKAYAKVRKEPSNIAYTKYYERLDAKQKTDKQYDTAKKAYEKTLLGGGVQKALKKASNDVAFEVKYNAERAANAVKGAVSRGASAVDRTWNTKVTGDYYIGAAQRAEYERKEADDAQKKNQRIHDSAKNKAEDKSAYVYYSKLHNRDSLNATVMRINAENDYITKSLAGKGQAYLRKLRKKYSKTYDEPYEEWRKRITRTRGIYE